MTAIFAPTTARELIVRNPNNDPLSMDQLRAKCPAVFATTPHEDVSQRYGFASTAQVLQALEKEGFVPVEARTMLRRDSDRISKTKHMLRLRRAGSTSKLLVAGEVVPQVVLLNSHDRTSLFQLYAGMFRVVCSNGLIVSTKDFIEPIRVRHTNRVVEDVMSNINRLAADAAKVAGVIDQMLHTKLTDKQQHAFARAALDLRFGNGSARGSVDPAALLVPRRDTDKAPTVWHVYNRVQENMIKGGIESVTANGRHVQTKEVVSVAADVNINAGLWELAMGAIAKARSSASKATRGK